MTAQPPSSLPPNPEPCLNVEITSELVDQHGRSHGRVQAVLDNPASDLLELEDGRLVPSVFIVDYQPGVRVAVEVPSGLLDGDDDGSGA